MKIYEDFSWWEEVDINYWDHPYETPFCDYCGENIKELDFCPARMWADMFEDDVQDACRSDCPWFRLDIEKEDTNEQHFTDGTPDA